MGNYIIAMANKNKKKYQKSLCTLLQYGMKKTNFMSVQIYGSHEINMYFFYSILTGFSSTVEKHPLLPHALAKQEEII